MAMLSLLLILRPLEFDHTHADTFWFRSFVVSVKKSQNILTFRDVSRQDTIWLLRRNYQKPFYTYGMAGAISFSLHSNNPAKYIDSHKPKKAQLNLETSLSLSLFLCYSNDGHASRERSLAAHAPRTRRFGHGASATFVPLGTLISTIVPGPAFRYCMDSPVSSEELAPRTSIPTTRVMDTSISSATQLYSNLWIRVQ
jgi:hypothetical protein